MVFPDPPPRHGTTRRAVLAGAAASATTFAAGQGQAAVLQALDGAYGRLQVEVWAEELSFPWSAVRLPGGGLLVSEKLAGTLRRVGPDGRPQPPLAGVPKVFAEGNAGMLGLVLDPDVAHNRTFYVAFAEPGGGGRAGLAVARATLGRRRIHDVQVLFRQHPKVADVRDFGGRLAIGPDGHLYVFTGDLFAQDLVQATDNTIGVVARITRTGAVPRDNPFVGRPGYDPSIWSYGHRNIGGAAFHPETGALWVQEFGPYGGDELNIVEPGRNYGWPLVSWGRHYTGEPIPEPPTRPDLEPSIFHWNPVISPSGMAFYDASLIPGWRGNLLIGGLTSQSLVRLTLRGERVIAEERFPLGVRIRDVLVADDGAVLLLTDEPEGRILRLTPATG